MRKDDWTDRDLQNNNNDKLGKEIEKKWWKTKMS